ncbi:MAG: protein-L-isoaspartate(D-aspartate) O-methyltransferase [Phycisphaerae bacterium]|jgi:protein-L-isoaspartate(D-aspartate) O-methyltransferase
MRSPAGKQDRTREREDMVQRQLARRGITSCAVLDAMRSVPRERFVLPSRIDEAYVDAAMQIDCGQTISQPYIVARMTELLELQSADRVLEVGTGCGYQTAILARLASFVYTIEWYLKLLNAAAERLAGLGIKNVEYRCGDGSLGWPQAAPFDAILVAAGAPTVPQPLVDQLADGGRLVAPVGPTSDQTLVLARRVGARVEMTDVLPCRFVKLLGRAGWPS